MHGESFDDLVGAAEQRDWEGKTKHLGCFEIDYQFDFRGSLDRQVCRFLAFENTAGIYASLTIGIRGTACIAHQTAGYDGCARLEDRRNPVVKRQGSELFLACNDEDIVDYDEPADLQWDQRCEGPINITLGAYLEYVEFEP